MTTTYAESTTLETELRRQIGVILTIADRVISGDRGTTQRELYRVAKALEKHLPAPALTADEKLFDISAELREHYRRLEMNPENAPQHFAALRSAVEAIMGRKEGPEAIYPSILAQPGVIATELTAEQMSGATVSSPSILPVAKCHSCGALTRNPNRIGKTCLRFVGGKNCQGIFESMEAHYPPMKVEEMDGAKAQREKSERESAEDAPLRAKETPSDVSAIFDEIESWRSRALASEKERDDLKARLVEYENAAVQRGAWVSFEAYKELDKKCDEWERTSKEHENARDLLQREVTRLTRERDQLREDLADEFSRVNKIRTALSTVDVSNDGPQFLAEVQHILSEL